MSILDTFFILFKSDASEVEQGVKKAKGATGKLEKSLGGVDKASAMVGKKFLNLATTAVASFASVFAVTSLISSAKGITTQSKELGLLGETLGESTAALTNWGRAVESVGGDSKAFEGTMRGLGQGLNDALLTGSSKVTKTLRMMGIEVKDSNDEMKTTLDLLPELAAKFGTLNRETQQSIGKRLGLDAGTIALLSKGESVVGDLVARQRDLNRVTDEETKILARLAAKWAEFKNLVFDIKTDALIALLPLLARLKDGTGDFVDLIRDNKDLVITFFTGLGVILAGLAIKALILSIPFMLTAAAVGAVAFALGLLVEDIRNFVSGNDSLIGQVVDKWGDLKDSVSDVIGSIRQEWEAFTKSISDFSVSAFFGGLVGDAADALGFGQSALATANAAPIQALGVSNAAASVGGNTRTSSVTVEELTIQTQATDADGIASGISDALETHLRNALDSSADGVAG